MTCRERYKSSFPSQICGKCDSLLNVVYDEKKKFSYSTDNSFWSYEEFMPDCSYKRLEAGSTNVVIADEYGLYFKVESTNPTKSFKDRGSVIELNKAIEYAILPVEAHATSLYPYSIALFSSITEPLSLKDFVGFVLSTLKYSPYSSAITTFVLPASRRL